MDLQSKLKKLGITAVRKSGGRRHRKKYNRVVMKQGEVYSPGPEENPEKIAKDIIEDIIKEIVLDNTDNNS